MSFKGRFLLGLLTGLVSFGARAIDYGQAAPGELSKTIVALARLEDDSRQDSWRIFCSGVVIAPSVVLTAAHCVQEGSRRPSREQLRALSQRIRIVPSPGALQGWLSQPATQVDAVHISPGYLRDFRGQNDLAILQLRQSLPGPKASVVTDPVLLKTQIRKNGILWLGGFGLSEQISQPSGRTRDFFGTLRWGPVRIDAKHSNEFQVVADSTVSQRLGFAGPVAPRDGDSGGPAFFRDERGVYSLVGLVSRSVKHNHGPYGAAITQIFDNLCWIESVAKVRLPLTHGFDEFCEASFLKPEQDSFSDWAELCQSESKLSSSSVYSVNLLKHLLQVDRCEDVGVKARDILSINLDATGMSDLGPVFLAFSRAERISARDNRIQELSAQSVPRSLRFLDLSYNNIRNWQPVVEQGLQDLRLVGQSRQYHGMGRTEFIKLCESGSGLAEQQKLIVALIDEFFVDPGDCIAANFELLRRRSLEFFKVRGLKDFSVLQGLETLERLSLAGQAPADLRFVSKVPFLRSLDLEATTPLDLSELDAHPSLQVLGLRGPGFQNLEALLRLPRLQRIELRDVQLPRQVTRELESRRVEIVR